MRHWLMKSEPDTYSIQMLEKEPLHTGFWDGVRNYQVRNLMRDEMKPGDLAFFYHSSCKVPGIVGIIQIAGPAIPDPTAFDANSIYFDPGSTPQKPRWLGVPVKWIKTFKHIIPLTAIRNHPQLQDMPLLRKGNRLSITPVSDSEWMIINAL